MKKLIPALVMFVFAAFSGYAQTQRTLLYEEFTGENCAPCAQTNPDLTTFIHQAGYFPTKILLIRYQSPIPSAPGVGSLYQDNPSESNTRLSYYSVPFAPYARFNGIQLAEPASQGTGEDGHAYWIEDSVDYPNIVPDSAIVNSPFALTVTHTLTPGFDSVMITVVITAAQNYTAHTNGSLVLQIAMEEAAIHFTTAPGSNGEKDFYDIMRKMVPSVNGTVLANTWTTATTQTITLKEVIPHYIHDKSQLAFVAFIEDNGPKRVHQAAYSAPQALAIDAGIPAASLSPLATLCNDTLNLSMTLENHGAHTVTTCSVNYQLDANPVQTQAWAGSLTTGQTYTLSFPTFTTTPGSHTVLCYSSHPNDSLDSQTENDTIRLTFNVALPASAPIVEGFESTSSLPNSIWSISHSASAGGADFAVTSNAAATGSKSIMIDNMNNTAGNNSFFQTSSIYDMNTLTSPTLTFKAAYQQKATTNADKLQIFTSIDCGNTWVSKRVITASVLASLAGGTGSSAYTPQPSAFTTYTVNINAIASSQNVMFRWEFLADPNGVGNNLYIDDINIVSNLAGIENVETLVNLNLYPNPSNGKINVAFNLSEQHTIAVNVTDMLGRVVETVATKAYQSGETILTMGVDKAYQAGVYFVNINVDGQQVSKKVLVQ